MTNRKIEPFTGIIKVKKYFLLEPLSDEVFTDAEDRNIFYFSIPAQLRFSQFEKITIDIKQNMSEHNFDVALGTIYRKFGLNDVIRVYDVNTSPERMEMIRSKFLSAISKLSE
jgi:virulence-associated protein VapD